jgi:hypothetical protein
MKSVIMSLILLASTQCMAFDLLPKAYGATCARYCNPAKSKPCGAGCITLDKTCRKSWTTSCVGERPKEAKVGYDKPKFVNQAPK